MSKFKYKERHAVIVCCDTEQEQMELFKKLKMLGFKNLKIVSV